MATNDEIVLQQAKSLEQVYTQALVDLREYLKNPLNSVPLAFQFQLDDIIKKSQAALDSDTFRGILGQAGVIKLGLASVGRISLRNPPDETLSICATRN